MNIHHLPINTLIAAVIVTNFLTRVVHLERRTLFISSQVVKDLMFLLGLMVYLHAKSRMFTLTFL